MSGSGAHNDDGSDEDICNDVPEHVQSMKAKKEPPHLTAAHT